MVVKVDGNLHTMGGKSVVERDDQQYRDYRKKWKDWPENFFAGEFPLHLDVEPTNTCNLRCPFCATTHNKYNRGFMKEKIWKKVIIEGGKNELSSMKFTYRGEPLLHKDLPRMVRYAKECGVLDVYFNTNAVLLNEDMIRKLIDAGLDRISISFEGFEKSTYEKYRVGSDFDLVVGNIIRLKDIKKELGLSKPLVRIQTVLTPEIVGKEKEYTQFWSKHVDEVSYLDMKDEKGNPDHRGIIHDWACHMLWQRICIAWDGTILPCVHDIYCGMKFGNVENMTIKEAWNSEQEIKFRDLHKTGQAHQIPACDRCPLRANEITKLMIIV